MSLRKDIELMIERYGGSLYDSQMKFRETGEYVQSGAREFKKEIERLIRDRERAAVREFSEKVKAEMFPTMSSEPRVLQYARELREKIDRLAEEWGKG